MIVHAATPDTGSSRPHLHRPARQPVAGDGGDRALKDAIGYAELITDDAVAKVSIVGVGIRSNPELAAKMFEALAERQINLLAVSSSEIKVSALIAEDELDLAVRVLHTAFGLDAGAGGMSGEGMIAEPRAVHGAGPRPADGADAPRHRVPRLRHRDHGRRDELDLRAPSGLGHLQRRRLRGDRLRGDVARIARHRNRRDAKRALPSRSASTSSPCTRN